ncbi:DUF922 domain-containing protein [Aurantimonas sp. C2-6-R+9]|uniref:DUF922 domain-containing Zn-dependent protease n=1 Tax=unclassified Aurantimonas TaxID=2638230 RepID=UPI002E1771DC|nr:MULTISPECIES: DUF922 domain-containing protein [unclassified Aurantimonas]MEC5290831.1 DUF922 domain-containing protein [Aurantimonas sp. C2-3-R2]MEC5380932.1 DUF922 domain-containing protein [Aurantimonas sp. C2-6-R+9]MEC5411929.1 DUF922 domain-containing protein [Aurantimonas sp. C2-4-R8]
MRAGMGSIVVGLAWLWAGVAHAGSVDQETSYFAVRGSTLAELDEDLNRQGPYVAETGLRHPGATEVKFDGKVTYKKVTKGCAVDRADLGLTLHITLPKWTPPKRVSARTVLVWRTLEADIKRHENQHATIAKTWLKRMEMAVRNLRTERTCADMEMHVNTVTQRYLAGHEQAQIEFDTIEGREVNFRLRRALNRNLWGEAGG